MVHLPIGGVGETQVFLTFRFESELDFLKTKVLKS